MLYMRGVEKAPALLTIPLPRATVAAPAPAAGDEGHAVRGRGEGAVGRGGGRGGRAAILRRLRRALPPLLRQGAEEDQHLLLW